MSTHILLPLFSLPVLALTSCANITFIGHDRAYDINAQLKPDLTAPLAMNAGFESKSILAVPPREPQPLGGLMNRFSLPKGDVLSTISKLDVTRIAADSTDPKKITGINYASVIATGQAAVAATSASPSTKGVPAETAPPANPAPNNADVLEAMKAISNTGTTNR